MDALFQIGCKIAVTSPDGLRTGGEVQIGRVILHAEAQVVVHGAKYRKKVLRRLVGFGHERRGR
jgi:hypothetical protein